MLNDQKLCKKDLITNITDIHRAICLPKIAYLCENRKETECSQCWSFIPASNQLIIQKMDTKT